MRLLKSSIIKDHAAAERELRAKVDADPKLKAQYGAAWDDLRAVLGRSRQGLEERSFVGGGAFNSSLFGHALTLLRYPVETKKSNELRLPEFSEANSPALRQKMFSTAPIYPELERLRLTFSLTKMARGARAGSSIRQEGARQEVHRLSSQRSLSTARSWPMSISAGSCWRWAGGRRRFKTIR